MSAGAPGSHHRFTPPFVGTVLNGRYQLQKQIGSGGMATVWSARDQILERDVAVKLAVRADRAGFGSRLRHEARIAARLRHPDIVEIYDYGEAALAPGGPRVPFIVMELLSGRTLHDRLSEGAPSVEEGAAICLRVAEAVASAHRAGVTHRDINPRNVMLTAEGVTVLDFGISFTASARTVDGSLLGTRGYVAPEVLAGSVAREPADVYAIGVLIGAVLPPGDRVVEDLVERCTARDPARRPSADTLTRLLHRRYPKDRPRRWSAPRERRSGQETTQPHAMAPRSVALTPQRPRIGLRGLRTAGAVGGVVAALAFGAALATPSSAPQPSEAAQEQRDAAAEEEAAAVQPSEPEQSPAPPEPPESTRAPGESSVSLETAEELVNEGEAEGRIRPDVALDLRQVLASVQENAAEEGVEAADTAELQEKVRQRAQEDGALDPEQAELLLDALGGGEPPPAAAP